MAGFVRRVPFILVLRLLLDVLMTHNKKQIAQTAK